MGYNKKEVLTPRDILRYASYLREQEKSKATVEKYTFALRTFIEFLDGDELTKSRLIDWKENLAGTYAAASVNTMLAAINGFLDFRHKANLKVKPLKIQKSMFCDKSRELSHEEYVRLVRAAESERLSLVIQTICATGIRVSELQFITAVAIRTGRAEINNKGKRRIVFLPDRLRRMLKKYLQEQKRACGPVFVTKTGKILDRSNIWREMKTLCKKAGVEPGKVFPHNLRHLFARTYYSLEKDLSRLADVLGHSNVNTTKIYTMESGSVHARQIERLKLIIT